MMVNSSPEAKSFIKRGVEGGREEGEEGVLTESNEINNKNIFVNAIGNTANMRKGTRTSTSTSMTEKQKLLIAELERQDSQDDEEVLRAKAIALNAARLLNSSSQSMSNSTNAKPASLLLSSITNKKKKQPNPLTKKRVMLDPEQRKLIEEKIGHTLEDEDNDMIMEHHHVNNVGENVKREIREVALKAKEKWKNSFVAVTKNHVQQQQQQQQQQNPKEVPPAISGTTASMSDSNLSINANESKVSAEANSSMIKPATEQISSATSKVVPQSKQLSQLPTKAPTSPNRPKQNAPDNNLRPTLTAVVWKRRSGFGKLAGINAWEKRLIALIGNQLMYYQDLDVWDEVNKNGENSSYGTSDHNDEDEDANADTNEEHNELKAGIGNNANLPLRLGDSNSKQLSDSNKDISYPSTTIGTSSPSSRSLDSYTNESDKPSSTNVTSSSDLADNKPNPAPSSSSSITNVPSNNNRAQKKNDIRNLWEQASLHIVNAQENIAQSFKQLAPNNNNQFNSNSSFESSPTSGLSASLIKFSNATNMKPLREPRGIMDLIKESVSIAIPNNIYNSHVHVLCNQHKQNVLSASAQNNSSSATNNTISASRSLSSSDVHHNQSTNPLNNIGLQISAAASSLIQAPSPTPFVLSILSKNSETKWKFCFNTQKDQMKWLWALSNVLIEGSVRDYNEGLVASNQANLGGSGADTDGINVVAKSHGDVVNETTATGANLLSSGELTNPTADVTPSVGNVADNITVDTNSIARGISFTSEGGTSIGRDQFWEVDDRCSLRNLEKAIESEEKTHEDDLSSSSSYAEEENRIDTDSSVEMKGIIGTNIAMVSGESYGKAILAELVNRGAYSGPIWSLRGANLCFVAMVVNAAIFYSRASTTSVNGFWLALVSVNFIIYFTVTEDNDRTHVVKSSKSNEVERSRGLKSASIHRSHKKVSAQSLSTSSKGREQVGPKAQTVTKSNFKPMAGETTIQVKNIKESPVINGKRLTGWLPLRADEVQVRSHGYLASKKKIASPSALYQVAKVDIFQSKMRVPDMATKVKLPEVSCWNITDGNTRKSVPKNWHSPDIFVVSVAVPTEVPKFGRNSDDGEGVTVTIYYTMREETRQILQRITVPGYDPSTDTSEADVPVQKRLTNSVRLWEEWCKRAPIDPKFQGRFKFIPNVHNLKEVGLPSWISNYCGKPVLIKRSGVTGILYKHPELNAMEFDVSIHPFPYLAKQATAYLKENMFKKILASFGFVIEGRCDDELPEVVIGEAVQLCYPDPAHIANADDFFAGTLLPSSSLDALKGNASSKNAA